MKSQALGRGYQAIPFAMLAPAIGFALVLLIYWIQQPGHALKRSAFS
jgi:hypothetical protein